MAELITGVIDVDGVNEAGGVTYRATGTGKQECLTEADAIEGDDLGKLQEEMRALQLENQRLRMVQQAAEQEDDEDFSEFKSPGGKDAFLNKQELTSDDFAAFRTPGGREAFLEEDFSAYKSPGGKEAFARKSEEVNERLQQLSAAMRQEAQTAAEQLAVGMEDAAKATYALHLVSRIAQCQDSGTLAVFREARSLGLVVELLGAHLANAVVALEGCRVVTYLARDAASNAVLAEEGVGIMLTGAMKRHSTDREVQLAAARAIVNITAKCDQNTPQLNESGELLISAMASLPEDEEMQLFGTMALKNLALNDEAAGSTPPWVASAMELMETNGLKSKFDTKGSVGMGEAVAVLGTGALGGGLGLFLAFCFLEQQKTSRAKEAKAKNTA